LAAVASADASHLEAALRKIPGHFEKSFCTLLGLMHSEMSWRCRLHPNVYRMFSALHQCDDLVAGVDNVFFTQVVNSAPPTPLIRSDVVKRRVSSRQKF
jgi:hypothetical protein